MSHYSICHHCKSEYTKHSVFSRCESQWNMIVIWPQNITNFISKQTLAVNWRFCILSGVVEGGTCPVAGHKLILCSRRTENLSLKSDYCQNAHTRIWCTYISFESPPFIQTVHILFCFTYIWVYICMRAHKTLESCVHRHMMCMFARALSGVYNNLV